MSNPTVLIKTTTSLPNATQAIIDYNDLQKGELGFDYTNEKFYLGPASGSGTGILLNPKDYFSSFTQSDYTLTMTTKEGTSYARTLPDMYVSGWAWTNGTSSGPTATITITDINNKVSSKTVNVAAIPAATADQSGIITNATQIIGGAKTFNGMLTISSTGTPQIRLTREAYSYIQASNGDLCFCANESVKLANCGLVVSSGGIRPGSNNTYSIGTESEQWVNVYAEKFIGDLEGIADYATQLKNARTINGTSFDGTANIVTNSWGTSRTISINSQAGTTGTAIDGSANATLVIPSTMTNFTSITSTNILGTNLGAAATQWTNLYVKNPYIYNSAGTYYNKFTSTATANRTLTLPDATGELVCHTNNTITGSATAPVYIAASGVATACGVIDTTHGGLGVADIAVGAIITGAGADATATSAVAPGTKGQILVSNGTTVNPIYTSPSFSAWTAGTTSGPKLNLTINGATTTAPVIPSASSSASGIVTTGTQTFAGTKTFNSAVTMKSTLAVTGQITASALINANASIKITGRAQSSGGTSYIAFSDTELGLTTAKLSLNGTKILLSSDNYGTSLPTEGMEEGQIFFLLTS